jgi:hypothetical protein
MKKSLSALRGGSGDVHEKWRSHGRPAIPARNHRPPSGSLPLRRQPTAPRRRGEVPRLGAILLVRRLCGFNSGDEMPPLVNGARRR